MASSAPSPDAPQADQLLERIGRFVSEHPADPEPAIAGLQPPSFDALASDVARFQLQSLPTYRRLAAARGIDFETLSDWRQAPAVPSSAFKLTPLASAPARVIFRSSGTTQGERRSEHHQPYPGLYRRIVDASFSRWCLSPELRADPGALSLVPSFEQVPDSSLGFMIDHILSGLSGEHCRAITDRGVDVERALRWLEARSDASRPALVLTTALALHALLEAAAVRSPDLCLAPGSVVFETGGFKGRRIEVTRAQLMASTERLLGVPSSHVVREYGMTELTSQCYTATLHAGGEDTFYAPPWMAIRLLEPLSLEEVPLGEPGLLAFFDLGNLGSVANVLTEDVGVGVEGGGFRLMGRARGAELRGCSLTVEELESEP